MPLTRRQARVTGTPVPQETSTPKPDDGDSPMVVAPGRDQAEAEDRGPGGIPLEGLTTPPEETSLPEVQVRTHPDGTTIITPDEDLPPSPATKLSFAFEQMGKSTEEMEGGPESEYSLNKSDLERSIWETRTRIRNKVGSFQMKTEQEDTEKLSLIHI